MSYLSNILVYTVNPCIPHLVSRLTRCSGGGFVYQKRIYVGFKVSLIIECSGRGAMYCSKIVLLSQCRMLLHCCSYRAQNLNHETVLCPNAGIKSLKNAFKNILNI